MRARKKHSVSTCPHSQTLHEEGQGLLASVKAIDDALCPDIITERGQSNTQATTTYGPKQENQKEALSKRLVGGNIQISIILNGDAKSAKVSRAKTLRKPEAVRSV